MNSRQAQVLSTELYSKPTHFLLELIQNADDCSYAPGVQPEVLLVLMHDALLHATNETGFTAADISSICSMAMSSKSRKVGAFTGEKGAHSNRSSRVSEQQSGWVNPGVRLEVQQQEGFPDILHCFDLQALASRLQQWRQK
jgi:hypothetical protein